MRTNQWGNQKQRQIQDLNFSHHILGATLSILESVALDCANLHQREYFYEDKIFGKYDVVNYKFKNSFELRNQLRIQMFLLISSFEAYSFEQKGTKWSFPSDLSL